MTTVRYFPITGIVLIRGLSITTTFRVRDRGNINHMLDWLGYRRVNQWEPDGANYVAHTERMRVQVAA